MEPRYRIGVDIGGTFTDIVVLPSDGRILTRKVSSTADNYAEAIIEGIGDVLREAGDAGTDNAEIRHGTTVASNAILEHAGAKVGLIATDGFRDTLEIRTLRMPRLYDMRWEKPVPLVERHLRLGVKEKTATDGTIQTPLDEEGAEHAVETLLAEGVDAIAVCLLNSFANPAHEKAVQEIVHRKAPDLPCCISSDVLPEIGEYERTSTTVVNAYVIPIVARYLERLRNDLDAVGIGGHMLLMQSNGGLIPVDVAARLPVNIIESGPAGGVVGAQAIAKAIGETNVISFDMGGTTAKAAMIENGEVNRCKDFQVGGGIMIGSRLMTGAGYLIKVPAVDLAEVGAGGGSVVWVDAGGSMRIGPRSAGAVPGPLCYDIGGEDPTVTDANLILGYINPEFLVGGSVKLNAEKAADGFEETIARPLRTSLVEAAYGAHQIAASNMIRAIKAVSTERGRDPREYSLFAFGGNGPIFGPGIGRELAMKRVIVPPSPGVFSSFGLLHADIEHHYSRTLRTTLCDLELRSLNQAWSQMEADALAQLQADGLSHEQMSISRAAGLRYKGQTHELIVPVPGGLLDQNGLAAVQESFGQEHEATYGHRAGDDEPVELVNLQVIARGILDRLPAARVANGPAAEGGVRRAFFGPDHGWLDTPVFSRADLTSEREGPCIVEEYDATAIIPPATRARLDDFGNILVELDQPIGLSGRAG